MAAHSAATELSASAGPGFTVGAANGLQANGNPNGVHSVYAGLNEARIELPVPRRDVRLRTVAAPEPGKD